MDSPLLEGRLSYLMGLLKITPFLKICHFLEQKYDFKQRPGDKKGPNHALLLPSSDLQAKLQEFERN